MTALFAHKGGISSKTGGVQGEFCRIFMNICLLICLPGKYNGRVMRFLRAFLPRRIIFSLHCLYRIDEETNILTGFLSFGVKIVIIVHVNCAGKKL